MTGALFGSGEKNSGTLAESNVPSRNTVSASAGTKNYKLLPDWARSAPSFRARVTAGSVVLTV